MEQQLHSRRHGFMCARETCPPPAAIEHRGRRFGFTGSTGSRLLSRLPHTGESAPTLIRTWQSECDFSAIFPRAEVTSSGPMGAARRDGPHRPHQNPPLWLQYDHEINVIRYTKLTMR